MRIFRTG
jgi:hypothetical protein